MADIVKPTVGQPGWNSAVDQVIDTVNTLVPVVAGKAATGHTHTSAAVTDFTEAVQDAVAQLLGAGSNVIVNYDDAANTLTISATGSGGTGLDAEAVRDAIGVALVGVGNIGVVVNDAADTITITTTATQNATDAALRDRDTHTDGTTFKGYTATEKAKLAGLAALASSGRLADALDLVTVGASLGKLPIVSQISPLQLTLVDPPYAGDLPEYSNAAVTAPVPATGLIGKLTRHSTAGGTFTQPLPEALPGRVVAFGWDGGTTAVTLAAASRTDTASTTSGSATVADPSITAADQGRLVTGAGIPTSYVGTVTPGVSFLLSSSGTSQVNVNASATASGVSIVVSDTIGGGGATTSSVAALADNMKMHCTFPGKWRTVEGFKSQSGLDARYPVTDQTSPALGMVPTITSLSPLRYGLATPSGGSGYTTEEAQDAVAALFTSGTHTGVSVAYDDANNRLNLTVTGGTGSTDPEIVRDTIAAALAAADSRITVVVNDAADTITIGTTATTVRVDGTPVSTFDVDSATPTAADVGAQPVDQDLTDFAALNPVNDDVLQRKAGVWTNRTIAQLKTDLGVSGSTYTTEEAQDAAAALFTSGGHTGIAFTYDDAGNRVTASVTGGSGSVSSVNDKTGAVKLNAGDVGAVDRFPIVAGETTLPRVSIAANASPASGALVLTYFTARKTETITQIRSWAATAAAATPTLCRVGIYREETNGDLTLLASIPNDTTMWSAPGKYLRTLSSSWAKEAGVRYAVGALLVTTLGLPTFYGMSVTNAGVLGEIYAIEPRVLGQVTGQSDLPSSVTAATITSNSAPRSNYMEMLP